MLTVLVLIWAGLLLFAIFWPRRSEHPHALRAAIIILRGYAGLFTVATLVGLHVSFGGADGFAGLAEAGILFMLLYWSLGGLAVPLLAVGGLLPIPALTGLYALGAGVMWRAARGLAHGHTSTCTIVRVVAGVIGGSALVATTVMWITQIGAHGPRDPLSTLLLFAAPAIPSGLLVWLLRPGKIVIASAKS